MSDENKQYLEDDVFTDEPDPAIEAVMQKEATRINRGLPQALPHLSNSAFDVQVGGNHYSKLAIQPIEYITRNGIPFIEGSIIKYATRWRDKGGIEDLMKIKHLIDLLIELETLDESAAR